MNLEEFMVFEDNKGEMGVILKNNSSLYPWWKCYRGVGGQIFNTNDNTYNNIIKLYKNRNDEGKCFWALKFMYDGKLEEAGWECVYNKNKKLKITNIAFSLDINPESIFDIEKIINRLNKELNKIKVNYNIKED